MALILNKIPILLKSLREHEFYITTFSFTFKNIEYVVIVEDLRAISAGTKYYAACLTFIDARNKNRRLQTYANAYDMKASKEELAMFFGIPKQKSKSSGDPTWTLKKALNDAMPDKYKTLSKEQNRVVLKMIDKRENYEGFSCYMARHNRKTADGRQMYRTAKNTSKTKILRPALYELLGKDKTISFCYRKSHPLTDTEIIKNLKN